MPNKHGRKWIRDDKRLAIYLRDGFACLWCGDTVEHGAHLTLDHYFPRITGGSNHETNLLTCCHACNSRRRNTSAHDYATVIAGENDANARQFVPVMRRISDHLQRPLDREAAKRLIIARGLVAAIQSYQRPVPKSGAPSNGLEGPCEAAAVNAL